MIIYGHFILLEGIGNSILDFALLSAFKKRTVIICEACVCVCVGGGGAPRLVSSRLKVWPPLGPPIFLGWFPAG